MVFLKFFNAKRAGPDLVKIYADFRMLMVRNDVFKVRLYATKHALLLYVILFC